MVYLPVIEYHFNDKMACFICKLHVLKRRWVTTMPNSTQNLKCDRDELANKKMSPI